MSLIGSVTNSPQKSPNNSTSSSRSGSPERRSPVGSNEGVLGVDSLSTLVVDEHLRSQLNVTSVDSSKESVEGSPNAALLFSDVHTPQIIRRRSDSLVGSVQEDVNRDSDVLLNAEEELGIDFLGDEHRDQHSPLPGFLKSAMKQKGRESLDSIRSETEFYLSPTMRKLYRESKGISTVRAYSLDHSNSVEVRELFSRTQSQVNRATEHRQELEASILKLELELGKKETKLREITMQYQEKIVEVGALSDSINSLKEELRSKQEALMKVKVDLEFGNKQKESLRKVIEQLGSQQRLAESRLSELMQKLEGKEALNVDEAISAKTTEIENTYSEKFQVLLEERREWQSEHKRLLDIIEKKDRRIEEADSVIEQEKRNTELANSAKAAQTKRIAELTNQNDAYVKEIEEFKVQLQQLSLQLASLNGTVLPVSRSPERGTQILFHEDAMRNGRFKEGKKQKEVSNVLVDTTVAIPSNSNRRLSGGSMGEEPRVENEQQKSDRKQKKSYRNKTTNALNVVLDKI